MGLRSASYGQDLENIKGVKWFDYSGGVSLNTTFYDAQGIPNRRDPFFWQLNANLNLSLFDGIVQAPFSMTISQQNKDFAQPQPFNRFGISPTYKDITLHLGHRTMNFSNYTLAGNIFLGAGVEYKPETNPIRVSAMYGRLAKPVARFATDGIAFALPTFRRTGYGAKVGFEHEGQEAHLIFFSAEDDPNSIPITDSLGVTPEQNLVLGLVTSLRFLEHFNFKLDYAYSLHTRDTQSPEVFIDDFTFVNNLGGLFTPTNSSTYTNALTSSLSYSTNYFQINGQYRRIDPQFTTLGSSFLNNDLEDISAGVSLPLFNNRLTVSTNAGVQRNNLDDQSLAVIRRFIFNASVNWSASERLQIAGQYGNFNSSTRQIQIQTDILADTVEFFQVTRNGSLNANLALGARNNRTNLSWSGSVQDATDSQGNSQLFISNTLNVQKRLLEQWNVTLSATANSNKSEIMQNLTVGPVLNVSRSYEEGKYRSSASVSQLNIYQDGALASQVTNFKLAGMMRAGERHNLSLNAFYILRRFEERGG